MDALRQTNSWVHWGLAAAVVLFATAGRSLAVDIVDTGGFEAYAAGQLQGQFAGASVWTTVGTGGSTAMVQSGSGVEGSMGVRIDRAASSEDWWAAPFGGFGYPDSRFVVIDWDMKVNNTNQPTGVLGPFIGVDAYDDSFFPQLLGSLGVDATTRDVLYQDPETGDFIESGATVGEEWRHYQMRLDYLNGQYSVLLDGAPLAPGPLAFVDGPSGSFGDADIAAYAAGADRDSQRQTATAFFDNFTIRQAVTGDYNFDGRIDAADYAVWRNGLGVLYDQQDYAAWRLAYGASGSPTASVTGQSNSAPEPAAAALCVLAAVAISARRRQAGQYSWAASKTRS